MAVTITYFVHGTTTDNEKDLATGWLPGELSELGIAQSKQLGLQLAGQKFDAIFCSDLQRAIESAKLMFSEACTPVLDARLRECNYGDTNGQSAAVFKDRMQDFVDVPFPNGESYLDVEARMTDFIAYLRKHYDGRHVAIVAHQAPQLALEVLLHGRTWQQAIDEDWRRTKAWKPGWGYLVSAD